MDRIGNGVLQKHQKIPETNEAASLVVSFEVCPGRGPGIFVQIGQPSLNTLVYVGGVQ